MGEQGSDFLNPSEGWDVSDYHSAELGVEEPKRKINFTFGSFNNVWRVCDYLGPKDAVIDPKGAFEVGDLVFARVVEPQGLLGQKPAFT